MARDTILQSQAVRVSHKRSRNIDASIPAVVRTRDTRKHNLPIAEKQPAKPIQASDTTAATAQQLADAAGATLPIFQEGIGPVGDLPGGAVHYFWTPGEHGNIFFASGQTIIRNPAQAEAVRALFLAGEQTVTEARAKLSEAIKQRDEYQRAVDNKLAVWQRAMEHSDQAYQTVVTLRKQQADAKAEAVDTLLATGVISPPRTVAIEQQLREAEQAFEVSTKARATVLADLQELKGTLARAEKIVLAHAFEVTQSESSLLAEQARYAVSIAQESFAALFSLEAVSVRYGGPANANGQITRPQVVSPAAIEIMRKHMPNGNADAAQIEQWAEYVTRLTKDSTATKEQPA